jgi:hypothetical protein
VAADGVDEMAVGKTSNNLSSMKTGKGRMPRIPTHGDNVVRRQANRTGTNWQDKSTDKSMRVKSVWWAAPLFHGSVGRNL